MPAPSASEPSQKPRSETRVMPSADRVLAEHGLAAESVRPTGPGGRLLKEDVLRHVEQKSASATANQSLAPSSSGPRPLPRVARSSEDREDEFVAMSPIRRRIAERLVEAQQTAALLT